MLQLFSHLTCLHLLTQTSVLPSLPTPPIHGNRKSVLCESDGRKAFISQSKELTESCLCSLVLPARPFFFFFLSFVLDFATLALCTDAYCCLCFACIWSWPVKDSPKVQVTG